MQNITIGEWTIEYDKDATNTAYRKCKAVNQTCSCITCKNYFVAAQDFPPKVNELFDSFGIDPTKPAEVYDVGLYENEQVQYGGFYHIVGNVQQGRDVWQPVRRFFKKNHRKQVNMMKIVDGFEVGFTFSTALVEEHFPRPVCTMEISFWVPWVIEESYPSLQQ